MIYRCNFTRKKEQQKIWLIYVKMHLVAILHDIQKSFSRLAKECLELDYYTAARKSEQFLIADDVSLLRNQDT